MTEETTMSRNSTFVLTALSLALAVGLSACGEVETTSTSPQPGPSPTSSQSPNPTPTPEQPTYPDGIFVAPTGSDTATGTWDDPVRTLQRGAELATDTIVDSDPSNDLHNVYVASGDYDAYDVVPGINFYGGYDATWQTHDPAQLTTRVTGLPALTAWQVNTPTRIDGFELVGLDAVDAGASSVAVRIESSPSLTLANSLVLAGNGADGVDGADGTAGAPGVNGKPGANAVVDTIPDIIASTYFYYDVAGNGGASVTSPCAPYMKSGPGGKGGTHLVSAAAGYNPMQLAFNGLFKAIPGIPGGNAGLEDECLQSGCNAAGADGMQPAAPPVAEPGDAPTSALGFFVDGQWVGEDGYAGEDGIHGTPGSGGGGAGGYLETISAVNETDKHGRAGGGGGSGGSGGCGGQGGQGGTAGGASIAILLIDSPEATITNSKLVSAEGGAGGRGGNGGAGGMGGIGGAGGKGTRVTNANANYRLGGNGGNGANGGFGGPGSGGAGGISVPVLVTGNANTSLLDANTFEPGTPGNGGEGGLSGNVNGSPGPDGHAAPVLEVEPLS